MKKEKSKMILNNRPQVENLNRQNDALRNNSEKGINIYTVFLCVVCVAIAVLFFVYRSVGFGFLFLGLATLLGVVAYLSFRSECRKKDARKNSEQGENTDAIFKDHED